MQKTAEAAVLAFVLTLGLVTPGFAQHSQSSSTPDSSVVQLAAQTWQDQDQQSQPPGDTAGEAAGNAVDQTGQAVGNAADQTGQTVGNAAEQTGQTVGNAAEQTGKAVGETGEAAGNAAEETGEAVGRGVGKTVETATGPLNEGHKVHIRGTLVQRNPDSLVVRTYDGGTTTVKLTDSTKFEEAKRNPFRGRRKYDVTQLVNGLPVKVGARADANGDLVAYRVKFTNADYRVGQSVQSEVKPIQSDIAAIKQNEMRLSGQIDENRALAQSAQQTANAANQRISALGNYDVKDKSVIQFEVGSAQLTPEAKQTLDRLAGEAAGQSGYLVEIQGFTSSEGSEALNIELSRKRAEAVADYLAINHKIPLRHMSIPQGYGASNPVASNATAQGRQENRRAEVSLLVNKGLSESSTQPSGAATNAPPTSAPPTGEPAAGDVSPSPR